MSPWQCQCEPGRDGHVLRPLREVVQRCLQSCSGESPSLTHTVAGIPAPERKAGFNIPVRGPGLALVSKEVACV